MPLSTSPVNLSVQATREADAFASNALARARAGFGHGGPTGATGANSSRGLGIIFSADPPRMGNAVPPYDPSEPAFLVELYLTSKRTR